MNKNTALCSLYHSLNKIYSYHKCIDRFLSEFSDKPYYKIGVKVKGEEGWKKEPQGKYISASALCADSSPHCMEVLSAIVEVLKSF